MHMQRNFHLVAFITFSYSAHLLINVHKTVEVIYMCPAKYAIEHGLKLIRYLGVDFGMHCLWNSELLRQKPPSNQN